METKSDNGETNTSCAPGLRWELFRSAAVPSPLQTQH